MKIKKVRCQVYLDRAVSERLEAYARKTGMTKSAIAEEALSEAYARQGAHQLDEAYGPRFDIFDRELTKLERQVDSLLGTSDTMMEMLGVFMQHQVMLVAHQPPFDEKTGMLGRKRFRQLLDIVEKRLAQGSIANQIKKSN
jgi:hypothetical protein